MLTKTVHRTQGCVRIIAGIQHINGPIEVKYWGVRTPVTHAALTPMNSSVMGVRAYTTGHIIGLVMGQHVDIIAIYRDTDNYRAFPGPTATRRCS